MSDVSDVPKNYQQAVEVLAQWHAAGEDAPQAIYHFDDPDRQEIRLIEVSETVPASGQVQVLPIGSSKEFPFSSAVALVTPDEWEQLEAGELSLPEKWDWEKRRQVYPHE